MAGKGPTLAPLLPCAVLLTAGFVLCYSGYGGGFAPLNLFELTGSVLFWAGAAAAALLLPLRGAAASFLGYVKRPFGALVFVIYLTVHLLLYGFLLEGILSILEGSAFPSVTAQAFVTTNLFYPASLTSALFDLAFNPSVVVAVPPSFSAVLSAYSISVALLVAVLVVASISEMTALRALSSTVRKARFYVLLPALGVVFGASCCLSVAGLVSLATPSLAQLASDIWVYYLTYFAFPIVAVLFLYGNLRSARRLAAKLRSEPPSVAASP